MTHATPQRHYAIIRTMTTTILLGRITEPTLASALAWYGKHIASRVLVMDQEHPLDAPITLVIETRQQQNGTWHPVATHEHLLPPVVDPATVAHNAAIDDADAEGRYPNSPSSSAYTSYWSPLSSANDRQY